MSEHDTLLSPAEVARQLGVSKATLRRWADEGRIRRFKIGTKRNSTVRFDPRDVAEFVLSQTADAA